ncbi:hypothetical protein HMPREF9374_3260 [Desmospora sp. 8437]|nr:hypothetical protein HMPREF9374_3260 [Desmospora sp. 8437]
MDFLSLLWAAFLAFGPVVLAHWLKERRSPAPVAPGTGHLRSSFA